MHRAVPDRDPTPIFDDSVIIKVSFGDISFLFSFFDILFYDVAAHVRSENFRYGDGAVGILIVFKNRRRRTSDCQSATVKGVDETSLAVLVAELYVSSARLEVHEIAARGYLDVSTVTREPNFDIIGLAG